MCKKKKKTEGHKQMAMMLIDHGAMVDKDSYRRWTPLFVAAQVGSDSLATFYFKFLMFTEFLFRMLLVCEFANADNVKMIEWRCAIDCTFA